MIKKNRTKAETTFERVIPSNNENTEEFNQNKLSQKKGNGFFWGIAVGIILTTIGLKFFGASQPKQTSVVQPVMEQKKTASQTITVTEVSLTQIQNSLEATGTVAAYESIPVMAQPTGLQITQVLADEGDFVDKGQVLVRLDNTVLKAELAQAQASVVQQEARLAELKAGARSEELQRAKENVAFAEADVRQSQSDLELARKKVERNRNLAVEGAIASDRLDEILNEEQLKESTLNKAKARLREAKQQLIELQKGTRPEVITQAEASLAEAKARVKIIMAKLKDTEIVAPVSGKIATREARVGDVTSSTKELFRIIENGRLELKVGVPETQLQQIRPGQLVKLTSQVDPNFNLTAKVREIEPTVDQESRQATVNIDLPSNSKLKPGMFLQAEIINSVRNALTIPVKDAFQPESDNQGFVYIVQSDNIVKKQPVTIGEILNDQEVEVKKGLKKGDRIAVKGSAYLKDGDKVSY